MTDTTNTQATEPAGRPTGGLLIIAAAVTIAGALNAWTIGSGLDTVAGAISSQHVAAAPKSSTASAPTGCTPKAPPSGVQFSGTIQLQSGASPNASYLGVSLASGYVDPQFAETCPGGVTWYGVPTKPPHKKPATGWFPASVTY